MADIVDLSSLIRRDETVDSTVAFDEADTQETDSQETGEAPRADDALTFDASADGLLDFGTARRSGRSPIPDPMRDWSNQELADLVRVQRLLCQAGVNVATDRGVTDEGDPWFVFLDAHGEVFVHLSRIDGQYILDSTVQEGVVSGPCFATLIERFAGRAEAVAAVRPDGTNVISLSRRGKIVMHPGAALAALVWSILLASEDMLFLEEPIPAADGPTDRTAHAEGTSDAAHHDTSVADYEADTAAFRELFVDRAEAEEFLATIGSGRDGADRALQSDLRDAAQPLAGVANALGITGLGLTALAAAYGNNRQQASDETETETDVAETDIALARDDKTAARDATQADTDDDSALKHVAAGQLFDSENTHGEAAPSDDVHLEADASERAAPSEAADPGLQSAAMLEAASSAALAEAAEARRADPAAASGVEMAEASPPREGTAIRGQQTEEEGTTNLARFLESVGLEDLLDGGEKIVTALGDRAGDASESLFRLIDETLTIVSVADVTERGAIIANARLLLPEAGMFDGGMSPIGVAGLGSADPRAPLSDASGSTAPASPFAFAQFSSDVRDFIDHLVLTSEIEVIALENQILLIDMRAVSESGAEAFARTWSLDEERTISTIGIKADFEAFDLVA